MKTPYVAVLAVLFAAGAVFAQDGAGYTLIGSASIEPGFLWSSYGDPAAVPPSWQLYFDATHRFESGNAGLTIIHRSALSGALSTVIYEAYLSQRPTETLDLYLGQKRLNIGTGFLYTPGDSFNPQARFFDQKTGGRGAYFAWSPNAVFGLSGGLSLEPSFALGEFNAENLLYSLQAGFLLDTVQLTGGLTWSPERTFNPTAGITVDLAGIIFSGEAAVEFLPRGSVVNDGTVEAFEAWTEPKPSAAAGARYTAGWGDYELTLSGDYLYSGQSWTEDETEEWKDWMFPGKASVLPPVFRNRHNMVLKTAASAWQKLSLQATAVVNLVDGSSIISSNLTFSPYDAVDLIASVTAGAGDEGSEWEHIPPLPGEAPSVLRLALTARYHF